MLLIDEQWSRRRVSTRVAAAEAKVMSDQCVVVLTVITAMSAEFCNVMLLKHAGDAEIAYVMLQGGCEL